MNELLLDNANAIRYEHIAPRDGITFVMFNPLTGDLGMWNETVGPALRDAGHGTLLWNYRGQDGSPVDPVLALDAELISADAKHLIDAVQPHRPVYAGLSIGGLFAARAYLAGAACEAMVFMNTLRRDGNRLQAVNESIRRCLEVGGLELLRDLYTPLIFGEAWLSANHPNLPTDVTYQPIPRNAGAYRLLRDCANADWNLPYDRLNLPVLVITGLEDNVYCVPDDIDYCISRMPRVVRVDVPHAGHMLPVEVPDAVTNELLRFVATL